ncbi:2-succinyl-6-hydroxy-2, 4-cyclohexadiene-1-carboxylate synthase [Comamonadaceae bacterium OS-1]|nr:2-succinyl-6-hydroxy-2, 4-cyclohexadiene-1-carboxylate synthase [Comamonadaceae bacterium OS-1]
MSTWIFLRGLARESGHWGAFTPQFENALPGGEVVALDLPGNGSLCQQASPTRVQDMVAHCRAELDRRWLPPPYHLLGMSLGAMVAVAWSAAHPIEVAAQVLVNTSLRPFSPFYQRLRPRNYGLLLRLALLGASPEDWERSVLRITSHGGQDAVLSQWLALRAQHPVTRANALRQLLAAARYRAPDAVSTPTLLLASAQDQLVSVACSQALARQWQCSLQVHPTAGHDLPLDDGDWVVRQIAGARSLLNL